MLSAWAPVKPMGEAGTGQWLSSTEKYRRLFDKDSRAIDVAGIGLTCPAARALWISRGFHARLNEYIHDCPLQVLQVKLRC